MQERQASGDLETKEGRHKDQDSDDFTQDKSVIRSYSEREKRNASFRYLFAWERIKTVTVHGSLPLSGELDARAPRCPRPGQEQKD